MCWVYYVLFGVLVFIIGVEDKAYGFRVRLQLQGIICAHFFFKHLY